MGEKRKNVRRRWCVSNLLPWLTQTLGNADTSLCKVLQERECVYTCGNLRGGGGVFKVGCSQNTGFSSSFVLRFANFISSATANATCLWGIGELQLVLVLALALAGKVWCCALLRPTTDGQATNIVIVIVSGIIMEHIRMLFCQEMRCQHLSSFHSKWWHARCISKYFWKPRHQ